MENTEEKQEEVKKEYLPHQQRVVDEKAELDEKFVKLTAFLTKETFLNMSEQDQNLLRQQHSIMEQYSFVLGDRINKF